MGAKLIKLNLTIQPQTGPVIRLDVDHVFSRDGHPQHPGPAHHEGIGQFGV